MSPFTLAEFTNIHPRFYHMSSDGAWRSLNRHGLLSTSAVLDLAGIAGQQRDRLERHRRLESVTLTIAGEDFVLRDQKPLNEAKLGACLVDMTVSEWLFMLNQKVFFWPSQRRCEELLGAKAYRDTWHTVIEVDSTALLKLHDVTLSPINSGAVLYEPPKRGSFTFSSIEHFPVDRYRKRGRAKMVAEVSVEHSVPEVGAMATRYWRARREDWVRL